MGASAKSTHRTVLNTGKRMHKRIVSMCSCILLFVLDTMLARKQLMESDDVLRSVSEGTTTLSKVQFLHTLQVQEVDNRGPVHVETDATCVT